MVDPMEVELTADEQATIESFQSMVESGTSVGDATLAVSTQAQIWYSFTPAVQTWIVEIIQKMEDRGKSDR